MFVKLCLEEGPQKLNGPTWRDHQGTIGRCLFHIIEHKSDVMQTCVLTHAFPDHLQIKWCRIQSTFCKTEPSGPNTCQIWQIVNLDQRLCLQSFNVYLRYNTGCNWIQYTGCAICLWTIFRGCPEVMGWCRNKMLSYFFNSGIYLSNSFKKNL